MKLNFRLNSQIGMLYLVDIWILFSLCLLVLLYLNLMYWPGIA